MAATAGRSRLLVLSRSVAGLTAGFPGLVVSRQRPHRTVHQRLPAWLSQQVAFCSTASPSDDVTVVYQNGFPVITVNLPSRQEKCRFTLKPISDSVGVFLNQLQNEDRGIDRVAIYSTDGSRVASSTGIDVLLLDDFKLSINDKIYDVRTPKRELLSHEHATTMDDVKHLVQQLHTSMHIKDFQVNREKELCSRLEQLQGQLEPHEKVRTYTTVLCPLEFSVAGC
ncbi:hypothetical protein GDO81_004374 [Engystomops pustulosus]|uniref:Calcium uniporter protein n=1 Tax=Engystomops pustulosus TaxID=76066 RepID=A0AAV6ZS97_ENGPU|nr:hypothetical protein GDO81_004374 [Engystomops pustulosus]